MSNSKSSSNIFGSYLKARIDALPKGMSSEQIAIDLKKHSHENPEASVSASLIRHWLNGTRIPKYKHPAIPLLAKILKADLKELYRKQEEAYEDRAIRQNEEHIQQGGKKATDILTSLATTKTNQISKKKKKRPAIHGTKELMETAISVLNNLPDLYSLPESQQPKSHKDKTVLFTVQGKISALQVVPELKSEWYGAIKSALNKGWHICHLIRVVEIEGDSQQLIDVITDILSFVGQKGDYLPKAFKLAFPVASSLMIAPSWDELDRKPEALISFAGKSIDYIDSAIYTNNLEQVEILRLYFEQLEETTEPIFDEFLPPQKIFSPLPPNQNIELIKTLQEVTEQSNSQIVLIKRLTDIVKPMSWFQPDSRFSQHLQQSFGLSSQELLDLLKVRKSRVKSLRSRLRNGTYSCKFIYMNGCVQSFSESSKLKLLNTADGHFQPNSDERWEQLETMLQLLDTPTYEMALLEEEMFSLEELFDPPGFQDKLAKIDIQPHMCTVFDDNLVVMEILPPEVSDGTKNCWLSISEKRIVTAFHEKLSELWDFIPPQRKDKKYIKRWIKQQQLKLRKNT
jgi:hypothetical protein